MSSNGDLLAACVKLNVDCRKSWTERDLTTSSNVPVQFKDKARRLKLVRAGSYGGRGYSQGTFCERGRRSTVHKSHPCGRHPSSTRRGGNASDSPESDQVT